MSGIAGIVSFDGEPIRRPLVRRIVGALAFRGPDGQGVWSGGGTCLVHTSLAVSDGPRERQPYTLDGEVWIVADARVDGREELARKLSSRAGRPLDEATDVELLLRSYLEWGSGCVDHLLGDFAFAIWDGRSRQLFCARDHFGVKPLYYAHRDGLFIFSNTLRCVLAHPAASDALNELAIADFLLFGYNKDAGTTTFADVKRLRPSHTLLLSDGELEDQSYWQLPVEEPLGYRRGETYVERFRELFDQAVADRLRTSQVTVLMSGGLDSTSVAATAHALLAQRDGSFGLHIFTGGYEGLIPDREKHYSELMADHLGVAARFFPADNYELYQGWDDDDARLPPQPTDDAFPAVSRDMFAVAVGQSPVVLTGMGGDPALYPSQRFPLALIPPGHFQSTLAQLAHFVPRRRRLPPLYLRTTVQRWLGRYPPARPYPAWLNDKFVRMLGLRARWEAMESAAAAVEHPWRPEAHRLLSKVFWPHLFENHYDAGATGHPIEIRHPYFDVRLVRFLLRVPPLPWFIRKELVRQGMHDRLPDAIRLRPKTTLPGNPLWSLMDEKGREWIERAVTAPPLQHFVDAEKYMDAYDARRELGAFQSPQLTRPLSLAIWLHQSDLFPQRSRPK